MMKINSNIKLISIVLLLFSFTFFSFTSSPRNKEKIKGKWYYNHESNYYKTTDGGMAKWYEFKNNSKVSFSSCTDMCGCMRVTYQGNYDWINDSTISVVFNKSKRRGNKWGYKLDKERSETLQVIRENKNKLRIVKIRD